MSPKKKKGQKERLKPLSFYGHDPKEVIKAFMHVNPEELKKLEDTDKAEWESKRDSQNNEV